MRLRRHILGLSIALSLICLACPAFAATNTIDTVGGQDWEYRTTSFLGKGNVYRVDTSVKLLEQKVFLSFADTTTLDFCVYESSSVDGTFTKIQDKLVNLTGVGADWYSSGPLDVNMTAGKYYMVGFSFPSPIPYYYGNKGIPKNVSFGSLVFGYANGSNPMPSSITAPSSNDIMWYQRLTTTAVPEPTALALLSLGLGTMVYRRRTNRR